MTVSRLLPIQIHGAIEMALAPIVMVAPLALGLDSVALVAAVLLGALLIGSALQTSGRAPRMSAHRQIDVLVVVLATSVALGSALSGAAIAAGLFAALAAVEALLIAATRYSEGRSRKI